MLSNNTHQTPIPTYLLLGGFFVLIAALVKLFTTEAPLEVRQVTVNGKPYHYQIREGEEQDTLTHMVKTYGNMFVANKMNKQCTYLTPRDTKELDTNTARFGDIVDDMIADHETLKQHIVDVRFKALNARYECGPTGRATVEHYTHASRAIALGLHMVE